MLLLRTLLRHRYVCQAKSLLMLLHRLLPFELGAANLLLRRLAREEGVRETQFGIAGSGQIVVRGI